LNIERTPFQVLSQPMPWPRGALPRRAAVNALGVGGTNAHVILEESPLPLPAAQSLPEAGQAWHLLTLSARTPAALQALKAKWQTWLSQPEDNFPPGFSLADAAYTLQAGRRTFAHRLGLVAQDVAGLQQALDARYTPRVLTGLAAASAPPVVWMFPGGGAPYPGAGRDLLTQPAFAQAVQACFDALPLDAPAGLHAVMFAGEDDAAAAALLQQPRYGLLALFILEYALARLWQRWGVQPAAVMGHSAGEYAAACLAGVMSLTDALSVVLLRGQLFEAVPTGGMLAVDLSEAELLAQIGTLPLDVAAVNAQDACIASGALPALAALEDKLAAQGLQSRRLHIDVAAHSRLLDGVLPAFRERMQRVKLHPPSLPFISNITGTWVAPDELTDPEYWVRHLRQTVHFAEGLNTLRQLPDAVWLEVGPGQGLCALARHQGEDAARSIWPSTGKAHEPRADMPVMLAAAAGLWTRGLALDWPALRGDALRSGAARRVSLPTYAFARQRHWVEPGAPAGAVRADLAAVPFAALPAASPLPEEATLQRLPALADWLTVPRWAPAALKLQTAAEATPEPRWLVFGGDSKLTAEVVLRILNHGGRVALVRPGLHFASHIDGSFTLAPADAAQHEQLFRSLEQSHAWPHCVLHLWALDAGPGPASQWDHEAAITGQALVFDSLRLSARAMQMLDVAQPVRLTVLTAGSQVLPGDTARKPVQALAMGPCRVMAQEMPQISTRLVDVQPDEINARTLARRIVAEAMDTSDADLVAFRGSERLEMQLVQAEASVPAGAVASSTPALALPLRHAGVYLITGGLGDIALTLAAYLARTQQARLALVSRRSLPPRSQWAALAQDSSDTALRQLLVRLLALQDAGAEVLTLSADVADPAAMARAVAACRTRFGALQGVFHTAGVLEDGPIHSKDAHSIRRVLHPKAAGAQVLHDLLPPGTLDFFAVFSSTSVYLGGAGQVDYVAANAMADALAAARPDGVVLHWGIWGDSGMAQRAYGAPSDRQLTAQGVHPLHPLLGMRVPVAAQAQGACFETVYRPQDLWVLSEHRVAGQPVLVGTAYIEIAWAALQVLHPGAGLDMRALSFGEAMVFQDAAAREVRIELLAGNDAPAGGEGTRYEFRVYSRSHGDAPWQEHARAAVNVLQEGLPALAPQESQPAGAWQAGRMAQAGAVEFGPRWHNLQRVQFEGRSGTAELELAAPYAADLLHYHCHPALTDMAATFALQALDAQTLAGQLFVPLSIARVRLQAALPRQLISRVHAAPAEGRLQSFDVRLHTPAGRSLASLEGFCLRGVAPQALAGNAPAAGRPPTLIASLLAAGIRSADADALFALIFAGTARDLTVSSMALADVKRALLAARPVLRAALPVAAAGDMPAGDAGLDPVERAIAAVWRDLLGIDQIDRQDDFFALGGHSLAAVRLFARIRKEFAVDLPLATLFKAPTLAALAALVTQQRPDDKAQTTNAPSATVGLPRAAAAWTPLVEIQPSEPGRQPIFCVHGAAGNVLNFKAIADRLGPGQGFYGLQAQGVDGRLPLLPTIEAMAAQYVAAIRTVDPAGPYRLVGYSGGGVIALEMARQLRHSGAEVGLLAMIDTLAPAAARLKISPLKKIWLMRHWSLDFALGWRERRRHTQAEQAKHALALQQRACGEPLAPELASALLYSHFVKAQARYEPQPYDGPVLLCRASQGYTPYLNAGPCLGWQAHMRGELRVVEIDGSHVSMLSGHGLTQLVQGLRDELQRADERQGERPGKPAPVRGPGASGFRAWAAGV
jgi:acyl transferase domain-containing protein/thioesterase domain-containing protein